MEINQPLFTISVSLLSIAVSARIAISKYLKEREFELVKVRYLEGSIDILASSINEQIKRHKQNWGRCLHLLKQFRELKEHFHLDKFDFKLLEIEISDFNIIAQYRLQELVGSPIFWQIYQLTFAFLASADAFMRDELAIIFAEKSGKQIPDEQRTEIVEIATKQLIYQNEECDKYFNLLKALFDLGKVLEIEKMGFKELHNLKDRDDIQKTVKDLSELFKDKLLPHEDSHNHGVVSDTANSAAPHTP